MSFIVQTLKDLLIDVIEYRYLINVLKKYKEQRLGVKSNTVKNCANINNH